MSPEFEARLKGAKNARERHFLLSQRSMTEEQKSALAKRKASPRREKKKP
jgi:hypothetical protein